jgi:hypothetical protein
MEHIPGEPLDKFIYKYKKLNEPTIQLYTKQIVDAIDYMHSKLVMHRYEVVAQVYFFIFQFSVYSVF